MKFDFHVHTDLSIDSTCSVDDAVSAAKKNGLSGIAIANHNVLTPVKTYDDFIIIPACEYSTDAGHLLVFFLTEPLDTDLDKDDKGRFPWKEIITRAHEQNALVFLAHPFAPQVERSEVVYSEIDGIEVYNARIEHSRVKNANLSAQDKASEKNLLFCAGSDAHFANEIGSAYCEINIASTTQEETLKEIYTTLKTAQVTAYGGTASPLFRVKSQWVKMHNKRAYQKIPKLILRTLRAFVKSLTPRREPTAITFRTEV